MACGGGDRCMCPKLCPPHSVGAIASSFKEMEGGAGWRQVQYVSETQHLECKRRMLLLLLLRLHFTEFRVSESFAPKEFGIHHPPIFGVTRTYHNFEAKTLSSLFVLLLRCRLVCRLSTSLLMVCWMVLEMLLLLFYTLTYPNHNNNDNL